MRTYTYVALCTCMRTHYMYAYVCVCGGVYACLDGYPYRTRTVTPTAVLQGNRVDTNGRGLLDRPASSR